MVKQTQMNGKAEWMVKQRMNGKANADDGDKDDDGPRTKTQPKAEAGAQKTRRLKKGPTAKKKTSPRGS